jgi:hypothetical protein
MPAPTMPPDGSAIGRVFRLAQKTDKSLDGLPLYAAPFPCSITAETGKVGCCFDTMPTSLTFTITDAGGTPTNYTIVYGEWYGGGVFFWQYIAAAPTAYTVAYKIDFFCFNPSGVYADFEAIIYFGDDTGTNTRFVFDTVYCCNPSSGAIPFVFEGTFTPPSDTEAIGITSSGSTWTATVTYSCSSGDPVPDQDYWLGLNTGKTLDGLPLYGTADCISDNGVSAGSTSHPFNMITESTGTARALFRLAQPTGKTLDGLPLYAAENDPCCDGGFIDLTGGGGGGDGVNTACCFDTIPETLYIAVTGGFSGLGTVTLTYVGQFEYQSDSVTGTNNWATWRAEVSGTCSITKLILQCIGYGTWALTIQNSYIANNETYISDGVSACDPLIVVFSSRASIYTSCGGVTWSATVTE